MERTLLFVTAGLGYGGAEKILCFVANSLNQLGYRVHIANMQTTDKNTYQLISPGITVHDASSEKARGIRRLHQLHRVKKIARETRADVIIGFTIFPNLIATIAAKMLGIKSIVSERGDPYQTIGTGASARILTAIINRANGGVFQTDGAMQFYSEKLQARGKVIPNPIFLPADGVPEREPFKVTKTVVSAGRLDNMQKRLDVTVQAFALFSQKHPDYVLRVIGDGPDEAKMRSWCKEYDIEDKVCFLGKSSRVMRDIVNDGMFLITSDYEGISNALLEAMALGLPCVSTDHSPGGARLLISDHLDGLLAPVGDVRKLADAMCEYAENPILAQSCGDAAKDVVNRFSPDHITEMWRLYIDSVIQGKRH